MKLAELKSAGGIVSDELVKKNVKWTRKVDDVEETLDFDVYILSKWIAGTSPDFVNIGADSKGHGLPEPPMWKVEALIKNLKESGIEIREKHNLERLMR